VFENRVLRKIFGPKRDEVTAEWSKLHNKELNDMNSSIKYYSGDQIKKNDVGGGGACNTYRGDWRGRKGFDGET